MPGATTTTNNASSKSGDNNIGTATTNNTTTTTENNINNNDGEDDEILVTEFPPPPYYYTLASTNQLRPPEIPHRAFRVAAKRVRMEKERTRMESERIRLEAEEQKEGAATAAAASSSSAAESGICEAKQGEDNGKETTQDVVMTTTAITSDKPPPSQPDDNSDNNNNDDDNDSITDPYNPNEPIVAVFGEIVEDPTLIHIDDECNNPTILRDNVKRLNHSVLQGFLSLVTKLVNDPIDNKKARDELSHNLFLMLQECNKFREHQAREILIETLERQLERREAGLELVRGKIRMADKALDEMYIFEDGKFMQG
mmetsp:Transcript_25060/g.40626  ORF Transcript_25060/g.40626 Transcript_25060/m.40626 type:complete len:313 (-) Transcript_25060:74-1012(-)